MNVLVLGSGGREHAIVWSLYRSERVTKIFALPGNGGIGELAENLSGSELDFKYIEKIVAEKAIDLVVVGPETPLVAGIVDYFEGHEVLVFGPNRKAAQLEGSKAFSKRFMDTHDIPTAKYAEFSDEKSAKDYLVVSTFPVVIKADGLAAGKGVVIAQTLSEALSAIDSMMTEKVFGSAGATVVIEEFLQGEEASLLVFVDRDTMVPM
ncbi:MAG: phosphoribosylamine--glycine ligase, partial [Candidatus Margulisiibacteriota bacterium]